MARTAVPRPKSNDPDDRLLRFASLFLLATMIGGPGKEAPKASNHRVSGQKRGALRTERKDRAERKGSSPGFEMRNPAGVTPDSSLAAVPFANLWHCAEAVIDLIDGTAGRRRDAVSTT